MNEVKFRVWSKNENPTKRKGLGTHKQNGYVMQYAPYHPHCNKSGYVMEHRLLFENELGRYLIPRKELIHHIDGNKSNNSLSNLKLSNPKDHAKGHVGNRNDNGTFIASEPIFNELKYRLYDSDRNIERTYTLQELISKTYRRGKFEFRGRFTGLKDKNGVEIYEGDICTYKHIDTIVRDNNVEIDYLPDMGIVTWFNGAFRFELDNGMWVVLFASEGIEVIGNIREGK